MNSNDYRQEQRHVTHVIKEIKAQIKVAQAEYRRAHSATRRVQKDYGINTSINYFEVDDRSETRAAVQQQRWLVSQNMNTENVIKHRLKKLQQLQRSPYFGRIDIQLPGQTHLIKLYIGTASCVDQKEHFLVFDWRAPIASVYYNGTLGSVTYHAPAGQRTVKLKKKRQFIIKRGQIKNMFDTNEIVGDEMLQHVLGQKNGRVMHNIVSTIQRNQNDIIRDTQSDLLVVQGVAGSGKTSTILQRIAFLLYHSRTSLSVSQILLLSPNRLFSHYISNVLPSLGEHNMRQITLADFFTRRFEGLNVQTMFDRYEANQTEAAGQTAIYQFKNSEQFMKLIKRYCLHLKPQQMAFSSILYNGRRFFGTETIKLMYESLPNLLSSTEKFLHVKNQLIVMLKNRIDAEADRPEILKRVENLSNLQYNHFFVDPAMRKIESTTQKRHFIAYQIAKKRLRRVYSAIFNDDFFDPYVQYQRFLKQIKLPRTISTGAWRASIHKFSHDLEIHRLSLDDAAPLLYLRDLLTGSGKNHDIKDLFVDEMQDYSVAQFIYLKHAFPRAKLTLIGDSEQVLFHNIKDPQQLLEDLNHALHARHPRLIRLNRAYRSTYQITNFAKALLPHGNQIQAFHRGGPLPNIIIRTDWSSAIKAIYNTIHIQLKTYNTIAIITKHLNEAKQIYYALSTHIHHVTLMSNTDRNLPKGVLIMPIYLAKGLEFDSVIAWNVSQKNYRHLNSLGILYTIVTRAMHNLTILSVGPVSSLITKARLVSGNFTIDHQFNRKKKK